MYGIYYQDAIMVKKFEESPELLMADATYKLNNLRMPVFLQLVVDGNAESEIVSVFAMANENKATLSSLIEIFKSHNSSWTKTQTVLTNKDMTKRLVYRELIPQASLQLCLFHVLKTMRREIHCEKMRIRLEEKNLCLEIITKMAYSVSEEEYLGHWQSLNNTNVKPVIAYILKSWHDIRLEWVLGLKTSCHYGCNTTNRIESINQKLKQVIVKMSNLRTFFKDLQIVITSLRQQRGAKIADVVSKKYVDACTTTFPYREYRNFLTPFAYEKVCKQLSHVNDVTLLDSVDRDTCMVNTSSGMCTVTLESCSCSFVKFNALPCKHIFALRKKRNVALFFESAIAPRWKLQNYCASMPPAFAHDSASAESSSRLSKDKITEKAVLSQAQKYKTAFEKARKLAELASEGNMNLFHEKMAILQQLQQYWETGSKRTWSRMLR